MELCNQRCSAIFKAKVKKFVQKVYLENDANDFTSSNGWLGKLKRYHGIGYLKIYSDILSRDVESITPGIQQFHPKFAEIGLTNTQVKSILDRLNTKRFKYDFGSSI